MNYALVKHNSIICTYFYLLAFLGISGTWIEVYAYRFCFRYGANSGFKNFLKNYYAEIESHTN